MCGIAGILTPQSGPLNAVFAMTEAQAHRGPDGRGHVIVDEGGYRFFERAAPQAAPPVGFLALGHRRLAILDTSVAGQQPMSADAGRFWITYNGEVYNYLELKQELRRLGFEFLNGTDTEVVLAAYRAWGIRCFARFNGMWGLAIWDGPRGRLVLSRDRFGVKPLHYAFGAFGLMFASEIKGLLASELLEPRLEPGVAADFLKWGVVNHGEESFFRGIRSFPPGHYVEIQPSRPLTWKAQPFWSLRINEEFAKLTDREASTEYFSRMFRSSIAFHLRSDVPVGACLSGGLDSSAIVCVAAPSVTGVFNTFTSCAEDVRFDERYWSQLVASRVGAVAHHVFPDETHFLEELGTFLWHQEEPFTSLSIYAQWCLMRQAREAKVPVLLDGQGADELLCGYRKFYAFYLCQLMRGGRLVRAGSEAVWLLLNGDRGFLRWREGVRYLPAVLQARRRGLANLVLPDFASLYESSRFPLAKGASVAQRQIDDLMRFSLPSLLRYEDRNSMAWSTEARVPFLDHRLAEFLVSLPTELKLSRGRSKSLMRLSLNQLVPEEIFKRRDKMGFVTEQPLWMRGRLGKFIHGRFRRAGLKIAGLLDQRGLVDGYSAFLGRRRDIDADDLFRAFILDAWMERFKVVY